MRKLSIFTALVVAMTAVSCVKDINEVAPVVNSGAVAFEATFDPATKALLKPGAEESKVEWEAGDQVGVLVGEGNYLYAAATAGAGTTLNTQATDVPTEGTYYAVYPYDAEASLAENVITTSLPAEQAAVLSSFTTHLAVAQAEGNKFSFKNVCGLVKVNVDADNVSKIVFEGNNSEILAGGINVTVGDAPSWTTVEGQGAASVTLLPASGQTSIAKGDYYFTVLPQTFSKGFKVTAYKGAETWVIRNVTAETTIARAGIIAGKSFFEIEGNGTEANPYLLKTAQDMVNMRTLATLGGETWFKMANDIDMEGVTNYVPVNYDQDFNRKIHFDGNNCTLSNFSCGNGTHTGKFPSLFGVLYGSCRNLNIVAAKIASTGQVAGVLGGYVGLNNKPATVEKVSVKGELTTNTAGAGGLAGIVVSSNFTNCSADVVITTSSHNAGGFAGKVEGESTFANCKVKADISNSFSPVTRTAAFAGYLAGTTATFTDCEVLSGSVVKDNSGKTAAYNATYGGFVAYAGSTEKTVLNNCKVNITLDIPWGHNVGGLVAVVGSGAIVVSGSSVSGSISGYNQTAGLIGAIEGASTVTVTDSYSTASVTGKGNYTAGMIGLSKASTETNISGCHATGSIKSSAAYVGGVVGAVTAGVLKLNNSHYKTGTISGTGSVGGLVGDSSVDGSVENCYCKAESVTGNGRVGGLFGAIGASKITNSYAETNVTGAAAAVGGLGGFNANRTTTVSGCHFSGAIKSAENAGGLFGRCNNVAPVISKCYTSGSITAENKSNIGGIVGSPSGAIISDCWSSINITAKGENIGGIVGNAGSGGVVKITNCFYSGNITGRSGTGGIIGTTNTLDGHSVENSIVWGNVTNTKTVSTQFCGGAVIGCVNTKKATGKDCWRGPQAVLTDFSGVYEGEISYSNTLVDNDNFENGLPPYISGIPSTATFANRQRPYHGKVAATGATISSVAKTLGWSTDIWNLDGDIPVLK